MLLTRLAHQLSQCRLDRGGQARAAAVGLLRESRVGLIFDEFRLCLRICQCLVTLLGCLVFGCGENVMRNTFRLGVCIMQQRSGALPCVSKGMPSGFLGTKYLFKFMHALSHLDVALLPVRHRVVK